MTITTKFALIAATAGLLAVSAPIFAATTEDQVPQGTLHVAGTDFTSAKSVAHLRARARELAFRICVPDGNPMFSASDQRKCYETAVSDGMAQIASRQQQALRATSVNLAAAQLDAHPVH